MLLPSFAHAVPSLPARFYGTVTLNGAPVAPGTTITAWDGTTQIAGTTAFLDGSHTVYVLDVPGDDPDTPAVEGLAEGATIVFQVDGYEAEQTATWTLGGYSELNLNAVPPPMPPVAADLTLSTNEDVSLPLTLSANDINQDPLTYAVVTGPARGTLSGTAPNLIYTPDANVNGIDSFTYLANDGSADSNLATVSITVNPVADAPVLEPIQSLYVGEGERGSVTVVASDADGDALMLTAENPPAFVTFVDNGDGTGTLTAAPGYADAGVYAIAIVASDGALSGRRTLTLVVTDAPPRPVAAFSASQSRNVAFLADGASIAAVSSVARYPAENAIDSLTGTAWEPNGRTNQWVTVELAGDRPLVIDRVALWSTISDVNVKDFEIRVSTTSTDTADFTTVFAGTLPREEGLHEFSFDAVEARYVQLFVRNNWGNVVLFVYQFEVYARARDGGIVSLSEGPAPKVVAYASRYSDVYGVENVLNTNDRSYWRSAAGQNTNQWFTIKLSGERTHLVDRIRLLQDCCFQPPERVKDFEIWLSSTTADDSAFVQVIAARAASQTGWQEFVLPAGPVPAKYVRFVARNAHDLGSCCISLAGFQLMTTDNGNAIAPSGLSANIVAVSSQYDGGSSGEKAIDFNDNSFWRTATNQVNNQWIKVALSPEQPALIDTVKILSAWQGFVQVKDFEIWVSTTGTDDGDFALIYRGRLPRDSVPHWITFPPVAAKYVKLVAVNNHGDPWSTVVNTFQVYSPQLGGATVPFEDLSLHPEGTIAQWHWDFGDGAASSERNPRHTFAGPGIYPVTLTVTDTAGVSDTASMDYTVLQPPTVDFTWTPETPGEGQAVGFADATSADSQVVSWLWQTPHLQAALSNANPTMTFPDDGDVPVTLTVLDSQFLTSQITKMVPVHNITPTVDIGPDGLSQQMGDLLMIPGDRTFLTWDDASAVDRANMTFRWDTGDGNIVNGEEFSYVYEQVGTYTVRITVTDPQGATAVDEMQVDVYDDAIPPTTTINMQASKNVAVLQNLALPSLRSVGATVFSSSSEWSENQGAHNLLDLLEEYPQWTSAQGRTTNEWAKILLANGNVYTIDRVRIQPRTGCCTNFSVKDFEVWVSSTSHRDEAFTKVLEGTVANSGTLQEFVFPGGPVAARYVKYVALNNWGGEAISTATFHVVAVEPLGPGGVVDASNHPNSTLSPNNILDGDNRTLWRTVTAGDTDGWVTILLADGAVHRIHGVTIDLQGHGIDSDYLKDFEIWTSSSVNEPAAYTQVYSGTVVHDDTLQHFLFDEVDAKYLKLVIRNDYAAGLGTAVRSFQVRATLPLTTAAWSQADLAYVTLQSEDNSGGSGLEYTEYSADAGATWTRYTNPFLHGAIGSHPFSARSGDVVGNVETTKHTFTKLDPSPDVTRQEASQAGLDWLLTTVNATSRSFQCVACHVQGNALYGISVSAASGYSVDDQELEQLIQFMKQKQDPGGGHWYPSSGQSVSVANTAHTLFGLAVYDHGVHSDSSENLVHGVNAMLLHQTPSGNWKHDGNPEPPTLQGDIQPTVQMIVALRQAIKRVDPATAAQYQSALDRAIAWLKNAEPTPDHNGILYQQDRALKLLGLIEGGVSLEDNLIVHLRNDLLARQEADGGWRENSSQIWTNAFATGQTLYALCRAEVSRYHPQVVKAIDWLIHSQSVQHGYWPRRYTQAQTSYTTTMWPVIALGCFGELGMNLTIDPPDRTVQAGLASTQTVSFTVSLRNTGEEDDIYNLRVDGGLAGWSALLEPPTLALNVEATGEVILWVTAPADLAEDLSTRFTVSAVSRKTDEVNRSATVTVQTAPPPTAGHATETTFVDGAGATLAADKPVRLAVTVRDGVDGINVTGPGAGTVTFLVAGIAVGGDVDADGDGVFEITWTPGYDWLHLGTEDLRAIYSGADRSDPAPDLLPSYGSGLITLTAATAPVAENQTVETDQDMPVAVTLTGWDPNGDAITFAVIDLPLHGMLSGSAPDLIYTPVTGYVGEDAFTFKVNDGVEDSTLATVTVRVLPTVPDLAVSKSNGQSRVAAGERVTYTISVSNVSSYDAARVILSDTLPVHTTFITGSHGATEMDGVVTWPGFALSAGASTTRTVTVQVDESLPAGVELITNTVIAEDDSVNGDDANPSDNAASDTDSVDAFPVLQLTKDDGGLAAVRGEQITYTLTYSNTGNQGATGVVITETVPEYTTFVASDSGWNCPDGSAAGILCTLAIGPLPVAATGTVTFTVVVDATAPEVITVITNTALIGDDGANGSDPARTDQEATVRTPLTPLNRPPVATDDTTTIDEDTTAVISVLANDTDADGELLWIDSVGSPLSGALAVSGTAQLVYTPTLNFNGTDSFTYTVSDGEFTATALVSVTVTPVNDAPVGVDDVASTPEDTSVSVVVTANDSDVDGDTLVVTAVTTPTNGVAAAVGASVVYTPALNFNGNDSFSYTISDGVLTDTATVDVTVIPVNDIPVADGQSLTTEEDTPLAVTLSGSDVDGDSLTYTVVTLPTHGQLSGVAPDLTYTPAADYSGPDNFTFVVVDGQADSAVATVSITVAAENDAPRAVDDVVTTDEDVAVAVDVLANDLDVEGDPLVITAVTTPVAGTASISGTNVVYTPALNFNGSDTFSYTISDGVLTDTAKVQMTVEPVNDPPLLTSARSAVTVDEGETAVASGSLGDVDGDVLSLTASRGTILDNGNGTWTWSFTTSDGPDESGAVLISADDGNGGVAETTIALTVQNVVPLAVDDSAVTDEEVAVVVDVLANDSDVPADPLTLEAVGPAANGTTTDNGDGTVTYTPAADFHGSDVFTYTVGDGDGGSTTASVTITVSPVNDAPVAVDDTVLTDEDVPVSIAVLSNDTDVDSDSLTITDVGAPAHGSAVVNNASVDYMPAANFHGTDVFTYTVSDGNGGAASATVTVMVTPVNDVPVADDQTVTTEEDTALAVTLSGSDVDGDNLTYMVVSGPIHGQLTGTAPDLTYTPNADYNGGDSFTFITNDGTVESAVATVTISVSFINDAPAVDDQSFSVHENSAAGTLVGDVMAGDADGDTLTFAIVAGNDTSTFALNSVTGELTVQDASALDFETTPQFILTVEVVDPAGVAGTATVTVSLVDVNETPFFTSLPVTDAIQDAVYSYAISTGDEDAGDTRTITAVVAPAWLTLVDNADGTALLSGTPGNRDVGSHDVALRVEDAAGAFTVQSFSVIVGNVNDPPTAGDDIATTDEDTAVTIDLLINDSDEDGDPLTIVAVSAPTAGTATIDGATVIYTPMADFNGADSFTYTVSDGALTATAPVTVDVLPVNDAPRIDDQSFAVDENSVADTRVGAVVAFDVDGDKLAFAILNGNDAGTFALDSATGELTVLNAVLLDFEKTPRFDLTVEVTDGGGLADTATIHILVGDVAEAPVAVDDAVTTDEDRSITVDVLANDYDDDGDALTILAVGTPAHGTASLSGAAIYYTPSRDYHGIDTFSYTIGDGSNTNTATVIVTVAAINDAPLITDQAVALDEDSSAGITLTGQDPDGDALTFTVIDLPKHGSLTGDAPGLTYTPAVDFYGVDSFTFQASDGALNSALATVSITVKSVNDAPFAIDDEVTTAVDTSVSIDVLANDRDKENDPLTVVSITPPVSGTATLNADDTVTYTPHAGFYGMDSFTYTVDDGNGGLATATVVINVGLPPVIDCELYPIALHAGTLAGIDPDEPVVDILNGTQPGNFGWLTWSGNPNVSTLVASLTPPGNSDTYINPHNADDHLITLGDWVKGKPGVSNSKQVRTALDALVGQEILVPVWDATEGQGNNTSYQITGFARIRITGYHLPGQNRISVEFLSSAICGETDIYSDRATADTAAVQADTPFALFLPTLLSRAAEIESILLPEGAFRLHLPILFQ